MVNSLLLLELLACYTVIFFIYVIGFGLFLTTKPARLAIFAQAAKSNWKHWPDTRRLPQPSKTQRKYSEPDK